MSTAATTHRRVGRGSSAGSLGFAASRVRLVLCDGLDDDVLGSGSDVADADGSTALGARSTALPLSLDLFLAALALVLERRALASVVVDSSALSSRGRADELEAVASGCWGNVKSI